MLRASGESRSLPAWSWRCSSPRSTPPSSLPRFPPSSESWAGSPPLLGSHRLSPGADGRHPAVRQAGRPVRPQAGVANGHRGLPGGLGAVRSEPELTQLIVFRGDPGAGRRRTDRQHPGGDRRRRSSPRAGPLPGNLRRRVRAREHCRPAARRVLHHAPVLALDLLHQSAARGGWRWRCWRPHCPAAAGGGAGRSTGPAPPCWRSRSAASCSSPIWAAPAAVGLAVSHRRSASAAHLLLAAFLRWSGGPRAGAASALFRNPVFGSPAGQPDRRIRTCSAPSPTCRFFSRW